MEKQELAAKLATLDRKEVNAVLTELKLNYAHAPAANLLYIETDVPFDTLGIESGRLKADGDPTCPQGFVWNGKNCVPDVG